MGFMPYKGIIYFYKEGEDYGFLSNFYPAPFEELGIIYKTSEHYYQAFKTPFLSKDFLEIVEAESPGLAKRLAKKKKTNPSWYEKQCNDGLPGKYFVMLRALYLKFTQNEDLRESLLETDGYLLREDSPYDFEWGWRNNGKNLLGRGLMEIRDILKKGESLLPRLKCIFNDLPGLVQLQLLKEDEEIRKSKD